MDENLLFVGLHSPWADFTNRMDRLARLPAKIDQQARGDCTSTAQSSHAMNENIGPGAQEVTQLFAGLNPILFELLVRYSPIADWQVKPFNSPVANCGTEASNLKPFKFIDFDKLPLPNSKNPLLVSVLADAGVKQQNQCK